MPRRHFQKKPEFKKAEKEPAKVEAVLKQIQEEEDEEDQPDDEQDED